MNISNTHPLPTSVTSKGQVTIPAEIRHHLGIKPGDRVRFSVASGGTVSIEPAPSRIHEIFGAVKPMNESGDDLAGLRKSFEEGVAEAVLRRDKK